MGKWFKQFEALIWAVTLAVVSLTYVYGSFATKEYVEEKHTSVVETLKHIQETLNKIDQRLYELARDNHK
jgi:predicted nucleotidyltransferase